MKVIYNEIEGELKTAVLDTILTDDYGKLAAITVSEWYEEDSGWYQFIVPWAIMNHIHRQRSAE